MRRNQMTYRTAAVLSLGITLVLHLFFLLTVYFSSSAVYGPGDEPPILNGPGWRQLIGFVSHFLLIFFLFILNFKVLRSRMSESKKMVFIIVGSVLVSAVLSYLFVRLQFLLFDAPPHSMPRPVWGGFFRDMLLAVIVIFISQILYLTNKRQQMAIEYETLQAENMRTRYETLKSQVDPHFLFNSLSTLDSLVGSDPERAREYIQKFSSVFRYTLQNRDVVTLDEELQFTRDYAALMQIRYGDSLTVNLHTDSRYGEYLIVPLGVQTLVENAIKHNVVSKQKPLVITIETTGDDTLLVSNNFQPKNVPEPGAGVGLANLSERYRLKWQREISIRNLGSVFCVCLPLIKP